MRRLRNDLPYTFHPPGMQMWLRPFVLLINRYKQLRKENRICEIEGSGFDEVAKLHVRYMVGGHAPDSVNDERVYRVEFPERPGALAKFLSGLGQDWNISMFHYRNHGAAYGRILVGVQVPRSERRAFEKVLDKIGYRHWDETENQAYQLYLGQREG